MIPLQVTARIRGPIALPHGPLALDALLAAQVALRERLPPPRHAADCEPIEIPVEREPGGRFHLCSFSVSKFERYDLRYVNRRSPIEQYQALGDRKVRRAQITAGPDKSYRIPLEVGYVVGDRLDWWCVGEADALRDMLRSVTHLGKRRAVGLGRVESWEVRGCDPWGGFPVMAEGQPLRPLPTDWPGLCAQAATEYRTLDYPYWDHTKEELCAVPRHH